ncbi:STAS domain-containing protein [Mesobacillus foraminis]|uniref:RsbT co-antagonist protein RsbR n=1 Tax=Mesobacillus foraminis TaxID=279826 RepID=A0A4V2RCY5_9BACI|nr:STAS domain-containing protein [Mesobacillus foraminis]TCN22690.1 rsbT co-antagonist protein RsbR [Mesobacillus foraminis]
MSDIKFLPQPYFMLNRNFEILAASDKSYEVFETAPNFLDLVDWESRRKAAHFLALKEGTKESELIMKTKESPYALFDVSINWNSGDGHILCIEKDHRLAELENIVEKHRLRLAETNLELLEKKEQVEQNLYEIKSLSCPFIKLTKTTALVPLFGDLDDGMIRQNEERILNKTQDGHYDYLLFDFNGVRNLTEAGVAAFVSIINELQLMGISPSIIGIKPNHAFYLNGHPSKLNVPFLSSLSTALKKTI